MKELPQAIYRSLGDALPVAVFFKDLEGRFQYVNRELCERLGLEEIEILGRTDHDLFPKAEADKFRADDLDLIRTGRRFHEVEPLTGPDGERRFMEVFKKAVKVDGKAVGV